MRALPAPGQAWSRRASVSIDAYAIYPPLFLHDHEAPDRLRRQLLILDWFFARFASHLPADDVIRYEDLVERGGAALFRRLGHDRAPPVPLESRNYSALYAAAMVEILLDALLAQPGVWIRFYRPADLEQVADAIRQTG